VLDGRFVLLPKPCGARPRSVALPWAAQFRAFPIAPGLFAAPSAEGGLFCESWFWRFTAAVSFCVVGRLLRAAVRFATLLPGRPADRLLVFMVRTGIREAAAAGAVRATTLRFCTAAGGIEPALMLAAPNELCRVGVAEMRSVTWAPRKEACVTRTEVRWIACPPAKALREATVTAFVLCA
jgi:hypothetical protein